MLLQDQTIKNFVNLTASDAPVPGGGCIAAMCASISAALAQMVAGLTVGKKKYVDVAADMAKIVDDMPALEKDFLDAIERDSEAFDRVMNAFALPKTTDDEIAARKAKIDEATMYAAVVPMTLARNAMKLLPVVKFVAEKGNKNCKSDIAVSTMMLRTAVRGALYNVRINLAALPESNEKTSLTSEVIKMEQQVETEEKDILANIVL